MFCQQCLKNLHMLIMYAHVALFLTTNRLNFVFLEIKCAQFFIRQIIIIYNFVLLLSIKYKLICFVAETKLKKSIRTSAL